MRILAIDYGTRKIGLALSDPTGAFVSRTTVIKSRSDAAAVATLGELAVREEVGLIILGYPLNVDGTAGEMAGRVEAFGNELKRRVGVDVVLADERYTSEEAENYLHLQGKKLKGNKDRLDRISAALILRDYLEEHGRKKT